MDFKLFVFWIFSLVLIGAAIGVITTRNPVQAALFLVLAFFNSAIIWMLMEAEFLAITLVLVYVGAVMVLFLFVVMMLDINTLPTREGFTRYLPLGALIVGAIIVQMVFLIRVRWFSAEDYPVPTPREADYSNTEELGKAMYTDYLLQFEVAAVILLVAIIAAIALTMRRRPETKYQQPSEQINVKKEDRLRIVSMDPEN
ncbi:NADH:ubiquinone oxidoreductase subunit J [Chromatiales bacterium (ex Bugula neritina AB1)]|nr:NADH:ubiquinone oxidoreductase subunit J [Chromatiales bacterium (ex Bugula neritina AB1)]